MITAPVALSLAQSYASASTSAAASSLASCIGAGGASAQASALAIASGLCSGENRNPQNPSYKPPLFYENEKGERSQPLKMRRMEDLNHFHPAFGDTTRGHHPHNFTCSQLAPYLSSRIWKANSHDAFVPTGRSMR